MKRIFILLLIASFLGACGSKQQSETPIEQKDMTGNTPSVTLPMGKWQGKLQLRDNISLPFRFEVSQIKGGQPILYLLNADEKILVNEIEPKGDSIAITMHIFNTQLIAKLSGNQLSGRWVKNDYEDYTLPFEAQMVEEWDMPNTETTEKVEGKWAVTFKGVEPGEEDEQAVGIFQQTNSQVTGTFLTATGDYRYLEGGIENGQLQLSCFDGEHAFFFTANVAENKLVNGKFYSGKHWEQDWFAKADANASLPDANSLTFLKKGYEKLEFSFPNLKEETVSLGGEKYKGKVVIVQLLGSWCPNCMDESKFLAPFYKANKDRGVEIIGLAFERSPEFEKAAARVEKMKSKIGIDYEILIAGTNSKQEAAEKLPMLNHVLAFPTTIFIDKQGKVRKIHTGFSGPGTGEYYEQFVEEFNLFVDKLLSEK